MVLRRIPHGGSDQAYCVRQVASVSRASLGPLTASEVRQVNILNRTIAKMMSGCRGGGRRVVEGHLRLRWAASGVTENAHSCVGVEEAKLVVGCDVADNEGSLADAPEAFALLQVGKLGVLSAGEAEFPCGVR